ncbi:MAG: hypothetical protein ACKOEO_10485 [Planctomycetaceae bacterium]
MKLKHWMLSAAVPAVLGLAVVAAQPPGDEGRARVPRMAVPRIAVGPKVQVVRMVLAALVKVAAARPFPIHSSKHSMRIATEKSRRKRLPAPQTL